MKSVICYVSTANKELSKSDISLLFKTVRQKNDILGVTGILMFSEGNFFQIMEGEHHTINDIFKNIKVDPRHYNVIKILQKPTGNQFFNHYHSGFTTILNHEEKYKLQSFLNNEKVVNPDSYKSISYLVQKFISN
tara:strand:+ start:408 stop:812 length:405 start_codon:yes stop_codon:yes gene_type:complete